MYIFNVFRIFVCLFNTKYLKYNQKFGLIFLKVVLVGKFVNSKRKGSASGNHKSDDEYPTLIQLF